VNKLEFKAALSVSDAGEITGLAWPFGTPDRVGDMIEKGAFGITGKVPMLFGHDQAQAVGVWDSISESTEGLHVKGRLLVDDVARAREVRALVREGAATGLSIGFVTKSAKGRAGGGRLISALDLHEISIVPIPCHPGAKIQTIKEMNPMDPETLPDHEGRFAALENDLASLKDTLGKVEKSTTQLETKLARPVAANDNRFAANDNAPVERKAFANYLRSDKLDELDRKALTVDGDAPKYVLAPEETSGEFLRNLIEISPVRAIADVRTIKSHTILLPKRTGVTNAKWKGEAVESEASEPSFDQLEIPVRELTTHVDISNWMLEDSAEVAEREVRMALVEDFAQKEGLAFVSGSTAVEPKGFMAETGIAHTVNGHAANLNADALITLFYAQPATYRNRGTWAMNATTLAAVRKLKDGHGNYLWQPSYQAGQPETILGRPVVELIDMPDIAANAFPIMFGDFKAGYRIYDRVSLSIMANHYLLATEGLVRFHARRRVGAGVVRPDAFRKLRMAA
jgi:HK97 family phage major capsid protein/HK97 family phage prohead protease